MTRAVSVATDEKVVPAVKAAIRSTPSIRARAAWVAAITGAFSATVLALEHVPQFLRGAVHFFSLLAGWK